MLSYKKFEFKELKEVAQSPRNAIQLEEKTVSDVQEYKPKVIKKETLKDVADQFIQLEENGKTKKQLNHGKSFKLNVASRDGFKIEQKEEAIIERNIQKILDVKLEVLGKEIYSKSYQEGLEKGKQESFQEYQKQAQIKIEELQKFIQSVEECKEKILQENEELIVQMIFKMVRLIFLKEVTLDKEYVRRLAVGLIQKVGLKNAVKLKVSPTDLEKVKEILPSLNASVDELRNISFEPHEEIQPGGIVLETDKTLIDAEIETQLTALSESLLK